MSKILYYKPFLHPTKRKAYQNFINDPFTFDSALIYEYDDPAFGVKRDIKVVLSYGVESVNIDHYATALRENFYRRSLYFGDVKKALAKDPITNEIVYEVVYVDIVDDLVNSNGASVSEVVYLNNNIYYPGSIANMRSQISKITLADNSYIDIDLDKRPLFMKTEEQENPDSIGYMPVMVLCYAKPGYGSKIISRVRLSGFDFKQLDFEVDRLCVEDENDPESTKYLIFERQSLSQQIPTDDYLFGPDWAENPEGRVRLDSENEPLTRT